MTIHHTSGVRFWRAWTGLGSLLLLLALSGCGESANLQTGLTDGDANEIVARLNQDGIESQKHQSKDGVTITIKPSDITRATASLQAAGLPRRQLQSLGQVFKKDSMISTPLEERARYIYGLSEELEFTLRQFDNRMAARVHVVLPERVAPGEPIQPSSAAVFVKYRPPLDEDTVIPRIRKLVASSIPGLAVGEDSRSKVTVVLEPAEAAAPQVEWTTVGPFMVQAKSAGWLAAILIGLSTLATISSLWLLVVSLAAKHPRLKLMLRGIVVKIRHGRRKGAVNDEEAAPHG